MLQFAVVVGWLVIIGLLIPLSIEAIKVLLREADQDKENK